MNKPKVLMTGSTGLLGSYFVDMYKQDFELYEVKKKANKINDYEIEVDLANAWNDKNFPEDIDVLVLLAQERNYKNFPVKSQDLYMINLHSTFKFLEYARLKGVKKIIYASTGGIYEDQKNALTENSPIKRSQDLSFYFATKLASENMLYTYSNFFDITIMRPFFIYGKNQNENSLFENLKYKIVNNQPIILNMNHGIKINPIHASDAATCLRVLVESEGSSIINIAGKEIVTIKELSDRIGKHLKKNPVYERSHEATNLVADTTKIEKILKNHNWMPLEAGIRECL